MAPAPSTASRMHALGHTTLLRSLTQCSDSTVRAPDLPAPDLADYEHAFAGQRTPQNITLSALPNHQIKCSFNTEMQPYRQVCRARVWEKLAREAPWLPKGLPP